ncbi:MAG: PUR family DNA/RNA-binding protein [Bacteroidetes bacterium]|nr:PUR family DNA/RNA-binding protein [Bacteroidota bacterium]
MKVEAKSELYTQRVRAGKRTYFFDVKSTRQSEHYITITESKRVGETDYEKHKIFIYREDFEKFLDALNTTVDFIKNDPTQQNLPDHFSHHYTEEVEKVV